MSLHHDPEGSTPGLRGDCNRVVRLPLHLRRIIGLLPLLLLQQLPEPTLAEVSPYFVGLTVRP